MITPKVNYKNLVYGLLPWQKRQPGRLALLRAFVVALGTLFGDFDRWRSNTRMIARVTSQVKVIEGYLRKKYNQPVAIKIITYEDGALAVGLESEGQYLYVGCEDEPYFDVEIPLSGEQRQHFGDAQFIVYSPASVDADELRADIERFRTAGTSYTIISGHYVGDNIYRPLVASNGNYITITRELK